MDKPRPSFQHPYHDIPRRKHEEKVLQLPLAQQRLAIEVSPKKYNMFTFHQKEDNEDEACVVKYLERKYDHVPHGDFVTSYLKYVSDSKCECDYFSTLDRFQKLIMMKGQGKKNQASTLAHI